jgi:hypothetical protein
MKRHSQITFVIARYTDCGRRTDKGDQQIKYNKCQRTFKNRVTLKQHLMSVRHKPLSDITCVADVECKKHFNCLSAQLHHLEAGRCVSGMTKTKLNAAIAANDTGRIMTLGGDYKNTYII